MAEDPRESEDRRTRFVPTIPSMRSTLSLESLGTQKRMINIILQVANSYEYELTPGPFKYLVDADIGAESSGLIHRLTEADGRKTKS